MVTSDTAAVWSERLCSSALWETAIDPFGRLRIDDPEDSFLHIYESHERVDVDVPLSWVPAKVLAFKNSTGNSPPWHLVPRLIPRYQVQKTSFAGLHNLQSDLPSDEWTKALLPGENDSKASGTVKLAPGSKHRFDLEVTNHTTAFLRATFNRPSECGGYFKITYAESYEDKPDLYKGERKKGHRRDFTKQLLGPHDLYWFQGKTDFSGPGYYNDQAEEIFIPFHWRTFRFLRVEICAGAAELTFRGLSIDEARYPLDLRATFAARSETAKVEGPLIQQLWTTSIRTLANCMHDCYEDCPFYEQLQYAMDTRSSALFTYCISGDDRLARQAIIQLHNSFQPRIGLTASRAPTNREQFIPHFSLYWICMLCDHLDYFGDKKFLLPFLSVADGILAYFGSRVDETLGLVRSDFGSETGVWNFVDWTQEWKPYGYPSTCEENAFSAFTNEIYAYTLKAAAQLVKVLGRPAQSEEYLQRAEHILCALREHCFDGEYFTDSLAGATVEGTVAHSTHSQIWAVLCGAVTGAEAQDLLRKSMRQAKAGRFVQPSIAMSFYTLRALDAVGGDVYDEHFHAFWEPWLDQLGLGMTTWVEDTIAQRSDCHAWGSVPLYEFIAEVAGIRPAEPGWEAIKVSPRLQLYHSMCASVPVGKAGNEGVGLVHVSWSTSSSSGDVNLRIRGEQQVATPVPLHLCLPGQETRIDWYGHEIDCIIKAQSLVVNANTS